MRSYKYEEYIFHENASLKDAERNFKTWEDIVYSCNGGPDWIIKVKQSELDSNFYNFKLSNVAKIWQGYSYQAMTSAGTPNTVSYSGTLVGNTVYLKEHVTLGEPPKFETRGGFYSEPCLYLGFNCDTVEEAHKMRRLLDEYVRLKKNIKDFNIIKNYKFKDESLDEYKHLNKRPYILLGIFGGLSILIAATYLVLRFTRIMRNIGMWAWLFFALFIGFAFLGWILLSGAFEYKKDDQRNETMHRKVLEEHKSNKIENDLMREHKASLDENILKHNEDVKKFADDFAKESDYPEIIKPKYLELLTIK